MRPNNQNKNRQRSRNGGRKHVNPLSRNYESNGPDVKVRGNAAHVAEKYLQLARDAQSSGDSVMAENYLQHAEHYFRIVSSAQAALNGPRDGQSQDDLDFEDDANDVNSRFSSPQPMQPVQQDNGGSQDNGGTRNERERDEGGQQDNGNERPRERSRERDRDRERPRETVEVAAVAEQPAQQPSEDVAAQGADEGEQPARKPRERRPRRRRTAAGEGGEASAGEADVSELPAFLTGAPSNAAE
jgi:hypothetical protein